MRPSWNINPEDIGIDDLDQPSMISIDHRRVSPSLVQEIVILAGSSWMVWVTDSGEIVEKRKMNIDEKQSKMEFDEDEKTDQEPEEVDGEEISEKKKLIYWDALTGDYFHKFWGNDINEEVLEKIKPAVMEDKRFTELLIEASKEETLGDEAGAIFYDICLDTILETEME